MNNRTFINHKILILNRIDSTNNYVANLIKEGSIEFGSVIMAEIQTNGRGQRGKTWQSGAFHNLIVSIPADLNLWGIENIFSINQITALALHDFLKKYIDDIKIKWPNDIMINNKKAAGILIENFLSSKNRKSVIGFGVNINQEDFEVERATSLSLETSKKYDLKELIVEVIDAFNKFLNLYHDKGEEYIHRLFDSFLWKLDEEFDFLIDEVWVKGKIKGSTMDGLLVIEVDGNLLEFGNGEVKY